VAWSTVERTNPLFGLLKEVFTSIKAASSTCIGMGVIILMFLILSSQPRG
jgi:hypothetical protein